MAKVADVEILLRAQVATLESDLNKAKGKLDKFARESTSGFAKMGSAIQGAFGFNVAKLGTIAGVAALGASLGFATKKALDFGSEIVDTARNLGITTDALQELRFAAAQAGVATSALDTALAVLNQNASQAASGDKSAAESFRRLGVEVLDANKQIKSTDVLFQEVIVRLGELGSSAERIDISKQLFGRGGTELGKLALEGAAGIDVLRSKAHELGLVIDNETLVAAEKAGDQFSALGDILATQAAAAILEFSGELNGLAAALVSAAQGAQAFFDEFRSAGNAKSLEGIVEGISELEERIARLRKQREFPGGGRVPNQQAIFDELASAEAKLGELQERLRQRTVGNAPPGFGGPGAPGLLAPRDFAGESKAARDAAKEAAKLAREAEQFSDRMGRSLESESALLSSVAEKRLEAEAEIAEALGNTNLAEQKRVEIIEARFERERALIVETVQGAEASQKAIADLTATRDAELAKVALKADESFQHLKDFAIDGISGALADLAITGKLTFESLGQSFLREFIQVAITKGVKKLADALADVASSFDTGGGSGGSTGFNWLSLIGLAGGGIVNRPTLAMVGESGPEAVIPLSQLGGGRGGDLEVIINNNAGAQVTARQARSGNGRRSLLIEIEAGLSDSVAAGGALGRTMEKRWGLTRRGERNG